MNSRLIKVTLFAALMLALSAGAALAATLVGTPGPDSISGTWEDDQIFTLEGNDYVDTLLGAEDSDKVYGNTGSDIVDLDSFDTVGSSDQGFGGAGNDTVYAQDGNFDSINCGAGANDKVYKDPGDTQTGCELVNPLSAASSSPAAKR
jgi:Ca2+-binding RTX toxin-like protein